MKDAKLVTLIVLSVLMLVFVLQNLTVVEIRFLFWSFELSRALLLLVILLAGISIGWLLTRIASKHPTERP